MENNMSIEELPEKVKRRLALFGMFYPVERKYERRWAKIFNSPMETITEKFNEKAIAEDYQQAVVQDNLILWRDNIDANEKCLFYFIQDATNFNSFCKLYKYIDKYKAFLTYAIVHQKKDGDGVYDIFRCSPFSYLEHCNRVRTPK